MVHVFERMLVLLLGNMLFHMPMLIYMFMFLYVLLHMLFFWMPMIFNELV